MLRFSEKVIRYTSGIHRDRFCSDEILYDATIRNLELVGEAATHVPEEIRSAHTEIPWRMIIAARNRLIHGYLGIDNDTLWSLITTDVPGLVEALKEVRRICSGPAGMRD